MNIILKNQKDRLNSAQAYIIFLDNDREINIQIPHSIVGLYPQLERMIELHEFKGNSNSLLSIPFIHKNESISHIICVGLGSVQNFELEMYRRAVARTIQKANGLKSKTADLFIPTTKEISQKILIHETIIIAGMTQYHFDDYLTQDDAKQSKIEELSIIVENTDTALQKEAEEAKIITDSINMARHWIDSPPIAVTPHYLATRAQEIAHMHGLEVAVFDERQIIAMGMGGLAGVSRGSDADCQLVILEYKTEKKDAPTIALVGKGITFDSGGLSLKPAQSMETMKDDMSGAAAVIATMQVIAQLKPSINVIALAPLSENLPSGKAIKPGDILKFYNGKTAEIKNTDAEGRLILADALSYAVKHYKPDAIIDIATLTGACAYALGPFYTGLMSLHNDLAEKIIVSGNRSGDLVWRLPMGDDYKKAIKSDVADLSNTGDGRVKAGAITAAHFLQNFVGETPWAHLDIAGTAFDVPGIPYFKPGATGAGIRLLTDLILHW
jgi:leucyl aminopeptidase